MPENLELKKAKRKFYISAIWLVGGIIYAVWPVDIIPDMLGPIGWTDDLFILGITFYHSISSFRNRLKVREKKEKETPES